MNHKKLLFLLAIFCYHEVFSQESYFYYVIYFKDKKNSEFSVHRPEAFLSQKAIDRRTKFKITISKEDLPISNNYLNILNTVGNCEVLNKSKWLNAVEVRFKDAITLDKINLLPCVSSVFFLGKIKINPISEVEKVNDLFLQTKITELEGTHHTFSKEDYGTSFTQNSLINVPALHNQQFMGSGMTIAVMDAGFYNAYKIPGINIDFSRLIVRDFVNHDNSVWEDDRHGANVLSFMKTYNPGTYIGSAPMANYILIRTEESSSEFPTEEFNWLAGAEFADSVGADIISSSLGYSQFDDATLSYNYNDLNGKSSIIAKAANIAHHKGIFIVVSAGNDGNNKWHKIGTPSDAKGVITIGSSDADGLHAEFSSYGPTKDNRIKPDFVVMGKKAIVASEGGTYAGNGTSYSTPIFAGALACLMQACPNKNYAEIVNALRISSTHFNQPDSAYGYGIPDMALAAVILGNNIGLDFSRDIFWENQSISYWENQSIHFRSSLNQTVFIKITGHIEDSKEEVVFTSNKIKLKKGEWLHNNTLHDIIARQATLEKGKQCKVISVDFITPSASYNRVFTLP